jgi:hypothetical protein
MGVCHVGAGLPGLGDGVLAAVGHQLRLFVNGDQLKPPVTGLDLH